MDLESAGGNQPNMQLLYEAALCIWQLTFLHEAAEIISTTAGVIGNLVEVAKTVQKEKVMPFQISMQGIF